MNKKFVINGKSVELAVWSSKETTKLVKVTPVGGAWVNRVATGVDKIHLSGILPSGQQIDGSFIVLDRLEDGTPILVSESYPIPMG